ncbi:hypothetical protein OEA41_000851 [Lepraria neglecta]|uniref:Xylanolytic transcriptional activator regulatory domain-containing protein n=1 Tax=Lepraria neglecta TaxID=209136 RepID=A0AAD9ZH11_9LECA|nr:hypothetical protein OEA41_000851 [Lepraria neglecta]
MQVGDDHWEHDDEGEPSDSSTTLFTSGTSQERPESSSLAEVFGYYGQSEFNTMALVRKLVHEDDSPDAKDIAISNEIAAEVRKALDMMLSRPILDFLVRYFVTKVNCVKGVALADIRKSCEEVINALAPICARLDPRGSLIRVQHIAFAGLGSICLGRTNAFWEALSCAIRVAQQIGLHLDTIIWASSVDELEKEMRRRTFCNLYIWDSCLSKRLDRIPFLPDGLSADIMPRMHLLPDIDIGADTPDVFTERVLRAQLARFWRSHGPAKGSKYDAIAAEERYESFCSTFLQTMPPVFALQPDKQWDELLPTLPMQRQLLHMAIFEFLCWNFRPTLLQKPDQVKHLPGYKQILISHNKKALAVAALNLLEGVSTLHMMMGGSHTRFAGIIVPIFEAAVPLLCLCADKSFPGDITEGLSHTMKPDPLEVGISNVTRAECMQAARDALSCLQTLAEVSKMAEVGARTLARLIGSVDSSPPLAQVYGDSSGAADAVMQASEAWSCDQMREYAMRGSQADIPFGNTGCAEVGPNWEEVLRDLTGSFGLEENGFLEAGHL